MGRGQRQEGEGEGEGVEKRVKEGREEGGGERARIWEEDRGVSLKHLLCDSPNSLRHLIKVWAPRLLSAGNACAAHDASRILASRWSPLCSCSCALFIPCSSVVICLFLCLLMLLLLLFFILYFFCLTHLSVTLYSVYSSTTHRLLVVLPSISSSSSQSHPLSIPLLPSVFNRF